MIIGKLKSAVKLSIYDIEGKLLASLNKYKGEKLNTNNLTTGVYLVKIVSGNKSEVKKIIVNK